MIKRLRRIFWIESVLACLAALLAVLTAAWPDWIEGVTGLQPDAHNGSLEWILVAGCGLVAAVLGTLASREWRRTAIASG
jgi:hypothetical protein